MKKNNYKTRKMTWNLLETTNEMAWQNRRGEETPAKKAMKYALEICKHRQGRPPSTSISTAKNVLKELNSFRDEEIETATNKNY